MYHLHKPLKETFSAKQFPFQGADPESANFLFIGLDANYDENIEQNPIFPFLLQYLRNGVEFWKHYGVHHPFLLPQYKGDGKFYHKTFSGIGFRPCHAGDVSFVELLHLPTHGKSKLKPKDLDKRHLQRLNDTILYGTARFIFIPQSVAHLMRKSGEFSWLLPGEPRPITEGHLKVWNVGSNVSKSKIIYWHYHFSVYGKFHKEKMNQIGAIRRLLENC